MKSSASLFQNRTSLAKVSSLLMASALLFSLASCGLEVADDESEAAPTASNYVEFDSMWADWASLYVECARKYGADAEFNPVDGSINNAYAPGRPLTQGLDADCVEELGSPPESPPLTDAFLRGLYELFLVQADCLRAHGYVISEPPSAQEWVENYSGESWNPLMDVHNAGLPVHEADGLCPQPDPVEAERIGSQN